MSAPIEAAGKTYGRLLVIEKAPTRYSVAGNMRTMWLCRCSCGNEVEVTTSKLQSGHTQSCGCFRKDRGREANLTHGARLNRAQDKEYRTWCNMRSRCMCESDPKYPTYGGRGIAICERWQDFSAFLADMGRAPSPQHSIDRINNDGNYGPENCRWATAKEQANNQSKTLRFTIDGVTDTISGWADRWAVTRGSVKARVDRGQPFEQIADALGRKKVN